MQNNSPIKSRILQFIDTHCSSKREFYAKTGISRGTLESKTGISEDTFTKIFATYHELSPTWVLVGEGAMLLSDVTNNIPKEVHTTTSSKCERCQDKERIIESQKETISALKEAVEQLKKHGNFDDAELSGSERGQKRKVV